MDRLGVICAFLGALLGRLGASWASLGPSWRYLKPSWGPLGGLWSRPGPKKPPTWPPEGVLENLAPPASPGPPPIGAKALCRTSLASALSVTLPVGRKPRRNRRFWPLGALVGVLPRASWGAPGASSAVLGPSWAALGPSWRVPLRLGPLLGRLGGPLEPSWALLGRKSRQHGPRRAC